LVEEVLANLVIKTVPSFPLERRLQMMDRRAVRMDEENLFKHLALKKSKWEESINLALLLKRWPMIRLLWM